jgi:hypothetical protein
MDASLSLDGSTTYYHAQAHLRGRLMNRSAAVAAAVLLLAAAPALAADAWRYGLDADLVHDDNATRGLYDGVKSDNVLSVEGSATRSLLLGPHSGAVLRGALRYTQFADLKDISNIALVGRGAWRVQPTLGFSAPWYELAAQAQFLRHADSTLRDGSIFSIDASVGSHVTDRVLLVGGVGLDKRRGDATGVYDLSNTRLWGSLDYRVGVRNTAYARLVRQTGDQVFNVRQALGLGVWALDPALTSVYGAPGNAYRIDATTLIVELGFNYPLRRNDALDISVLRSSSKANEGLAEGQKYTATQLRASYVYRFQ